MMFFKYVLEEPDQKKSVESAKYFFYLNLQFWFFFLGSGFSGSDPDKTINVYQIKLCGKNVLGTATMMYCTVGCKSIKKCTLEEF